MFNTRRLFVCSCIALVTSAFTFSIHGDVMQEIGYWFNFTQEQNGSIAKAIFWGMAASMLVGGFVCDFLGIKRVMFLALASHLVGVLGIVFASQITGWAIDSDHTEKYYWWMWVFGFIMGCGNGWTEVGINPLVATLFPRQKTQFLNILHAWWPGGLVIGGLLAQFLMRRLLFHQDPAKLLVGRDYLLFDALPLWRASLLMIVVPAIVYGLMLIGSVFPATERVESGVSNQEMFKEALRPMFLLWAFCMLLTAATELGPQKWQESVITNTAKVSGTLILVYTSGMMFVLRHFAGPIAHKLSPVGMLTCSALLSCVGLYLLSYADNAVTAFGYATIYGLGIAYFWPTMLGVAAERFPKGGALILALMGTAGNISIGLVLDQMGGIVDRYSVREVKQYDTEHHTKVGDEVFKMDNGKPIALDEQKVKKLPKDSKATEVVDDAKKVGFSMAFRWVSLLPLILVFLFGAIAISDRM
ncbi:MAG TPA: MFS transporter, partial [Gemmataceae bacterium]|nr:MFS transporter [Gemmataceae bacterium]